MGGLRLVAVERAVSREVARLAAPAAFLLAATIAVLLVRSALDGGRDDSSPPERARIARAVATTRTTSKAGPVTAYYTIRPGDTLARVASRRRTTVGRLLALNPGLDPVSLRAGQRIRVR